MKKFLFTLAVIALVAIAALAGSPYYAALQLNQAYQRGDGQTVADFIDFDQLRPNVKKQLRTQLANTLGNYPAITALGGAPLSAFADQFINSSVDQAVTAQNVAGLVQTGGQVNQATKQLAAAWAVASNKIDLTQLVQQLVARRGDVEQVATEQLQLALTQQAAFEDMEATPKLAYCGYDCFTITTKIRGYTAVARLQRQGWLTWQVVDVTLP